MRWHQISEDLARQVLEEPDGEEASASGRVNRWRRVGDRFLRITIRDEPERLVVISAVFKRRPPERGRPP
jgi:hypothetical protein